MARPAPAIDRTVRLLDFLASHPDDAFTLSELSRRTGITKATAHAMLNALADNGYLVRHPTEKTFALGPALVAVGTAAARRHVEVVDVALPEMRRLSDELGVQVVASAAVGDEIVMLARAGEPEPFGVTINVGQRLPLVPPLGTVFLAWSPVEEIDRWLRRLGAGAPAAELTRYRDAVETVRRRGWSVGLDPAAHVELGRALGGDRRAAVALVEELGAHEYMLLELERAASYRLSQVAAPVFGAGGDVVLALTLIGFSGRLSAERVRAFGEQVLDAARTVTKAIGGDDPAW